MEVVKAKDQYLQMHWCIEESYDLVQWVLECYLSQRFKDTKLEAQLEAILSLRVEIQCEINMWALLILNNMMEIDLAKLIKMYL